MKGKHARIPVLPGNIRVVPVLKGSSIKLVVCVKFVFYLAAVKNEWEILSLNKMLKDASTV